MPTCTTWSQEAHKESLNAMWPEVANASALLIVCTACEHHHRSSPPKLTTASPASLLLRPKPNTMPAAPLALPAAAEKALDKLQHAWDTAAPHLKVTFGPGLPAAQPEPLAALIGEGGRWHLSPAAGTSVQRRAVAAASGSKQQAVALPATSIKPNLLAACFSATPITKQH